MSVDRLVALVFFSFSQKNLGSNMYKHAYMYAHKCQEIFPLMILSSTS